MRISLLAALVAIAPLNTTLAAAPATTTLEGERGWFGVQLEEGDGEVRVRGVIEGTPAADAGLDEGDVLLSYGGSEVKSVSSLIARVGESRPGDRVDVRYRRGEAVDEVTVLIGVRPESRELLRSEIVGKPARPLSAMDSATGEALELAAWRGKVVLVDFWEPWCGPCLQAMPDLAKLHRDRQADGLVIVGIAGEDPAWVRATARKRGVPYTIGLDVDTRTSRDWLVASLPTAFLVDREGVVREMFVGSTPKREVAEAVDALLAE